jgi:hypothetical protein
MLSHCKTLKSQGVHAASVKMVINADGEEVMTEITYKQLRYMPRLKRMFISKKIAMHMRWHKEGECENSNVMVHRPMMRLRRLSITLTQTLPGMPEMFASG